MNTDPTNPGLPAPRTGRARPVHLLLALLTVGVGAALLAFMVTVEGEPGALPLLLIVGGAVWFAVVRARGRASRD